MSISALWSALSEYFLAYSGNNPQKYRLLPRARVPGEDAVFPVQLTAQELGLD